MTRELVYYALFFGIGYALGRLDGVVRLLRRTPSESFVAQVAREEKAAPKSRKIEIDDSKFVTGVSTVGLEASGQKTLGIITQSEDNITSAANKLAALKKTKG